MKKIIKWIIGIVLALALVLIAAVILLPRFYDPNEHKPQIESLISEQIGRQVSLQGPIEWKVFPWLALTFHDLKVANEKGFKGDHLAQVDTLSARLKVAPLLKKQIRVGTVAIDGADINLQVAANGHTNWQSLADALASDTDSAPAATTDAPVDLKISGIKITDSRIHYRDKAAAMQAELADVNLETGRIEAGQPLETTLSASLDLPDSGLRGQLKSRMRWQNVLDSGPLTAQLTRLSLEGQLKTESGSLPLSVSLPQAGSLDIDSEKLEFPQVRLNLANAEISSSVSGTWKGAGDYAGKIQADDFNLRAFLSALGGAPLNFANPDAMGSFSLQSPWRLRGNRLQVPDIQAQLDQTAITGTLDLSDLEKLKGTFALSLDAINADDYMPADTSTDTKTDTAPVTGKLDFGHLSGTLALKQLRVAGARFENTRLKLITNGGRLHITPLQADFYQGLLNTQVLVDTNAPRNKVKLDTRAKDIHVGPLMKDVAGEQWLTGLGQLTVDVALDDPFAEKPLKTAHGQVAYQLADGEIYGLDVMATVKQALSALQQLRQPGQKEQQDVSNTAAGRDKKTEFASIRFLGDIQQGVLSSRELSVVTPFLEVGGKLKIDLDAMTIDGTITPMLTAIPEDWVDPKYRQLLNLPIPVRLSGSLTEPSVSIDVAKLLLATQKNRIDKKKKELKKKLLGKLLGEDSSQTNDESGEAKGDTTGGEKTKAETGKKKEAEQQEGQEQKKPESTEDKLKKKLLKGLFGDD